MHSQLAMVFAAKQGVLLHAGIKPGERHMQITTTGWMMWSVLLAWTFEVVDESRNAMVGHLCCGITIVLYDGNPIAPERMILFDIVDEHK